MTKTHLLSLVLLVACGGGGAMDSGDDGSDVDAGIDSPATIDAPDNFIGPTPTSESAAKATAANNAVCTAAAPFYWEIGDKDAAMVSGSIGQDDLGNPVVATTKMSIASASKWVYGTYVAQIRNGVLKVADVPYLNFTSGYTNMGNLSNNGPECSGTPNTVNTCLAKINAANSQPYSYKDPTTTGKFDYDGAHLENHASAQGELGDVLDGQLGSTVASQLGTGVTLLYTQPLIAGGIYTDTISYGTMLRHILDGSLKEHDVLGTHPSCTTTAAPCNAVYSPIPEAWHYSMAHWVEDDASVHGDGAFSSAGAFGYYPWINAQKTFYGIVARQVASTDAIRAGYQSARCGRLIRHAWETGVEQTGEIPN